MRNLGTSIEFEPVVGPDGSTVDIRATVICYQPKSASALANSEITGRYLQAQVPKVLIHKGEEVAFPCVEHKDLPPNGAPVPEKWDPAEDVFVVIDRLMPDSVSGDPHFYNTN